MDKKYLSVAKRHFSMASADIIIIMDKDRLINPGIISSDDRVDLALRPKRLNEIIGQDQIRENLSILLTAAKQRN